MAEWAPADAPLPFRVICGTSAGAIIGSVLAAHANRFREGATTIEQFWSHFRVGQVWRNNLGAVAVAALRWLGALVTGGGAVRPPHSLFDNTPLRQTLESHVNFARVQQALHRRDLDALTVHASPYQGPRSRTYVMTRPDERATFPRDAACELTDLTLDHLMASAAVPFLFPAVRLEDGYYGDGAMRQREPLAPALSLGADRILVLGVRGPTAGRVAFGDGPAEPSFGQIVGFMLDTLFSSGIREDLERIERDNQWIALAGAAVPDRRPVRTLFIEPSTDPGELVAAHARAMPFEVRLLMRFLGAANRGGRLLLSYLLFEGPYARELIALGYADAQAQKSVIQSFLSNDE
jgi:NTE family protein